MPQFDTVTFFNQIFWLILAFLSFYFLVLKGLLPILAVSLKTRKKVVSFIVSSGASSDSFSRKSYYKNLQKFLKTYKTLFSTVVQKKSLVSEVFKNQILSQTFFSYK